MEQGKWCIEWFNKRLNAWMILEGDMRQVTAEKVMLGMRKAFPDHVYRIRELAGPAYSTERV